MTAIRRTPKIPLSPSSPPESDGLKQRPKRRLSEDAPNSPSTPPLMSVATKSYDRSYENARSSAEPISQTSPASPVSSAVFTQHSTQAINHSFPTPASSAFEFTRVATMEDQHRDKRQKMEIEGEGIVEVASTTMATNHDRQSENEKEEYIAETAQDQNRNLSLSAVSDNSSSKDASLEKLRKDMGDAFFLCKSTVPRSRVDPKTHLLSRFGLGPLLRSVARTDPSTGEKINKLRSTWKAQYKDLGLAGRPDVKKPEAIETEKLYLRKLVEDTPEEEWEMKHSRQPIEITPDIKTKLQNAMKIQPGTIRNNAYWENVLGHEKRTTGLPLPSLATNGISFPTAPIRQTNGIQRPRVQAGANAVRPRRTGKKRSYVDNSFEGYGEGFGDDDGVLDDGAFDDEDEDGGSARKKRKKEHSFGVSPVSYGGGYVHSR